MNAQHIIVLCSCPDETVAQRIARALVEERLAACVNRLIGVRSTYRWEGALQDEPEVLLLVKTAGERYRDVELRLRALHPYTEPEIIALPIVAGAHSYLAWLGAQSRAAEDGGAAAHPRDPKR